MISNPYENQHPIFPNQREYRLERAVLDTGDDSCEANAILTFRHCSSGQIKSFRFRRVAYQMGCIAVLGLRGYLPVYVARVDGRGWEGDLTIEVGDTDPGDVWFWAESVDEASNHHC